MKILLAIIKVLIIKRLFLYTFVYLEQWCRMSNFEKDISNTLLLERLLEEIKKEGE